MKTVINRNNKFGDIHIFAALINNNSFKLIKITIINLLLCISFSNLSYAQYSSTGKEYFKKQEYNKAKDEFEKAIKKKEVDPELHQYYVQTLVLTKSYTDAEKYLKKQIKQNKNASLYVAELAIIYQLLEKPLLVKEHNQKAITMASTDEDEAKRLTEFFIRQSQYDWAIELIKLTRDQLGNPGFNAVALSKIFSLTDNKAGMIEEYLIYAEREVNLDFFKAFIQDEIKSDKDLITLEKILYNKVQQYPDRPFYTETLVAHLVNQKQFYKAFLQARALDKRMKYDGSNVYDLAMQAKMNKDFAAATKMFEYLVKEYPKAPEYPYYRRFLINCKEEVVKVTYPVDKDQINSLLGDYDRLVADFGINNKTVEVMKNKANLLAFYLDNKTEAEQILKNAIVLGKSDNNFVARCKLDLGDIQVLNNDFWEATLTYAQVDKAEKDSPIGYEAKFKNAKLHFYKGDFEVAQDFLEILKKATSREIANDAMDLLLIIRNNMDDDSLEIPLTRFAAAEKLKFQNKLEESNDSLSIIIEKNKESDLVDDALYARAQNNQKTGNIELVIKDLQKILKEYKEENLGDDVAFWLGKIYEEKMEDKKQAMEMYELILKDYPASIYVPEARMRFRKLRGDIIN